MLVQMSKSSIPIGEGIIIGDCIRLLSDNSVKGIDRDGRSNNPILPSVPSLSLLILRLIERA